MSIVIPDFMNAVSAEARRIEEDALYSSRGHFAAARRWSRAHFWLGLPAAIGAAISSAAAIADNQGLAAVVAVLVTALTATLTFLNPSDKSHSHHAAGTRFSAVRNSARRFREVELRLLTEASSARDTLTTLAKDRDNLNDSSPQIPRWAFLEARRSIEAGEASHAVDTGRNASQ